MARSAHAAGTGGEGLARGFSRLGDQNIRDQYPDPTEGQTLPGDTTDSIVVISDDPAIQPRVDPKTGALSIDTEDGGVVVHLTPPKPEAEKADESFYENLADEIDDEVRNRIVDEVMRGIEADLESRKEWEDMRAEGIKMLGTALEQTGGSDVGNSTGPFEGMSRIRHPLLMEACARFQANAAGELYPPGGPVKVRNDRPSRPAGVAPPQAEAGSSPPLMGETLADQAAIEAASRDELAEALELGFNHNLTTVDRGYRPDKVRMLFYVAFDGCAFVKVYDCPIRERPMSRFIAASDIIVSNGATDLSDCGRYTHRSVMRQALVTRMQIAGVYRDVKLFEPSFEPNAVEQATATAQGLADKPQRMEDQPRTIYESYVELDVRGFEHQRGDRPTGLPLPYKVTIDKDSREMLELRRNWEEDDDTFQARRCLVKYGFMPALGFYDLGFLHLLGNGDRALTAAWREALDCGMLGNFPGFIYNEGAIRNWTNQNRIPPGGGLGIKGVPTSVPLRQVIEPLPYKDVGAGMVALIQHVEQRMDRVAGTAELPVGEGHQDAPVGTTLALIEQATKILAAAHIGLHASQAEELELLKERYKANPESFWRWHKKPFYDWEEGLFLRALEDCEIVPAADPNTPSHMHRLMKWQAMVQMAMVQPMVFKLPALARRVAMIVGIDDPDEIVKTADEMAAEAQAQQGGIPPDPNKMAALQQKTQQAALEHQAKMEELSQKGAQQEQEHQARMLEAQIDAAAQERDRQLAAQSQVVESADRAADRTGRTQVAQLREQTELAKVAAQHQQHQDQLAHQQQQHEQQLAHEQRQGDAQLAQQQHEHTMDTFIKPHAEASAKPPPTPGEPTVE